MVEIYNKIIRNRMSVGLVQHHSHFIKTRVTSRRSAYAQVTLMSDYRTISKSAPIVLILKSEQNVPILKIDEFAVKPARLIGRCLEPIILLVNRKSMSHGNRKRFV